MGNFPIDAEIEVVLYGTYLIKPFTSPCLSVQIRLYSICNIQYILRIFVTLF